MRTDYTPTPDELRAAYQDTRVRQQLGWSFEKAMATTTIAQAVTNIARERALHGRPAPAREATPQLQLL